MVWSATSVSTNYMGRALTELTRRELRELERSGGAASDTIVLEPEPDFGNLNLNRSQNQELARPELSIPSMEPEAQALTRRQLRELVGDGSKNRAPSHSAGENPRFEAPAAELQVEQEEPTAANSARAALRPGPDGRVIPRREPLPPIGLRRELRQPANDVQHEEPEAISSLEIEIPEEGFRGANYLGEPSTQSIMLDIAPEAISLPLDTGEVFSTGSISILSDPTGNITGGLDGLSLDSEEAVTGVISIVDPVSAKDLIDERSPLGVVPSRVLLKGWWRPWVVGAFSLALAIAAILASVTIFNALGA